METVRLGEFDATLSSIYEDSADRGDCVVVLAIVGVIVAAIVLSVGFCCYKSCRSRKSLPSRPEQSKGKEMEYEPRGDASRPPSFQVSPRGSYYQSGGSQSYR